MGYEFTMVDVFTDRPFGGNQLAVFTDAEGIDDRTMQQLAREFNFSETTFVLPPSDPANTCRVRIFTPREEMPFAGHPTVGTAAVLASRRDGATRFVFEEGIGPVTVTVDGPVIRLHLASPDYQSPPETPTLDAVAGALTLPEDAVAETWYAGAGLGFCFVRLAGRELVDRVKLDGAAWEAGIAGGWAPMMHVFAVDGEHVYARMFAPGIGVEEDPATGSACASLVASLAMRSGAEGTHRIRVEQGVAMGRPSLLDGTATVEDGRLTEVVVGGEAVIVGNGTMTLPAG